MKKKITSLVLAICLIVPCLVMLTACGPASPTTINVSTMAELSQALANDKDGDTIVLNANLDLQEVNNNSAITITSGKHILDLNSYTITGVEDTSENSYAIDVSGADTELIITDKSEEGLGKIEGRVRGIKVSKGAKLTINDGQFVCTQNNVRNQSVYVLGGELVINDGYFIAKKSEIIYSSSYHFDNVDYHSKVTINGGIFNSNATSMLKNALLVFEKNTNTYITQKQVVEINDGEFNQGSFMYIVSKDNYVTFTNNAEIPNNKIEQR